MTPSRTARVALGGLGLLSLALLGGAFRARSAHADPPSLTRNAFGEADEEVTAVTPVPSGFACGPLSVGSGLTVQTSEPAGGFTGACLMNRAYGATLPSVCYSPGPAAFAANPTVGRAVTPCTAPAASVQQPNWSIGVDGDAGALTRGYAGQSYRVLETCVPHVAGGCSYAPGTCPCGTQAVSQSCCTHFGASMTSSDGQTATGIAYFPTAAPASSAP